MSKDIFFPPFRIQLTLMNCPTTNCQSSRTYNHYEWFSEKATPKYSSAASSASQKQGQGKEYVAETHRNRVLEVLANVSTQSSCCIFLWKSCIHPLIQITKTFNHFALQQKYGT